MIPSRKLYFIGLNVVRALSVVSLILVFASTILMMVNNIHAVNAFEEAKLTAGSAEDIEDLLECEYIEGSTVPNQPAGVFWAIVASLLILIQTIILFLSEISWPLSFFDRFFPVLGSEFGTGALGIFQALIATQILSHHVDDFSLVAAFLLFSVGCLNMLVGLIFRAGAKLKRSIRGWRADAQNPLQDVKIGRPVFIEQNGPTPAPTYISPMWTGAEGSEKGTFVNNGYDAEKGGYGFATSQRSDSWRSNPAMAGMGFGRQAEKAAGLRGFMLQRPEESLPRYVTPVPAPRRSNSSSGRSTSSVSTTSSFGYHEARQEQLHNAILEQTSPSRAGARRDDHSRSATPVPAFKSSPSAL